MNSRHISSLLGIFALAGLLSRAPLLSHANQEVHPAILSLSIPNLQARKNERVVAFAIHVSSGRIASLPDVPIGWSFSIDNDPSWNTTIDGSTRVGASAVTPDFFREFLFIQKNESPTVPFRIWGEVALTEDFTAERRVKIDTGDLILKPATRRNSALHR